MTVTVRYESRVPGGATLLARGERCGEVIAFWWGFTEDGAEREQLSYLLPAERFLLAQPATFPAEQAGWWYCDLVAVLDRGDEVVIRDRYIDVVVGPPDQPYRLLDLDEHGAALAAGLLGPADSADDLACTQRFLDRHLNRRHGTQRSWPDFPPAAVSDMDLDALPGQWTWLT